MDWFPANSAEQELINVFDRRRSSLMGTVFYVVGNLEDARDVLQDSFVKCWSRREELPSIGNIQSWVFTVALNSARDRRKSAWSRRRQSLPDGDDMLSPPENSPEASVLRDEEVGRVRTAILMLDPGEQEVFLLRQNGDLTYDEIANSVGAPLGTVKTRMRSALRKLREAVSDHADA